MFVPLSILHKAQDLLIKISKIDLCSQSGDYEEYFGM